ncbi:MAG: branched-chain amino acid ABC transporter permease [Vulcanimicrobiaceae bacterium]
MTLLFVWLLCAGVVWGIVAAALIPGRYRKRARDPRLAAVSSAVGAMALGPLWLGYLWFTPKLVAPLHVAAPLALALAELGYLFAALFPQNPCATSPGYVADIAQTGLVVGCVYATIAVGLTLIFSVQNVINFAHGQFVMFGGVAAYLLLARVPAIGPFLAIPIVGVVAFAIGYAIDRTLLDPMYRGRVERKDEYALLATFAFGTLLQYVVLGGMGPTSGIKAPGYTAALSGFVTIPATFTIGPLHVRSDFIVAAIVGLGLFAVLAWFLNFTWTGRSFRAVATNPVAAAVAGINSRKTASLAFGMGTMLAAMAGAVIVPIVTLPIPEAAYEMGLRSYVIVVLGGLGSVSGALLGGLVVGIVESLGAGCYPDPSKGATYQVAFSLLAFAVILLVRPNGLFGRRAA